MRVCLSAHSLPFVLNRVPNCTTIDMILSRWRPRWNLSLVLYVRAQFAYTRDDLLAPIRFVLRRCAIRMNCLNCILHISRIESFRIDCERKSTQKFAKYQFCADIHPERDAHACNSTVSYCFAGRRSRGMFGTQCAVSAQTMCAASERAATHAAHSGNVIRTLRIASHTHVAHNTLARVRIQFFFFVYTHACVFTRNNESVAMHATLVFYDQAIFCVFFSPSHSSWVCVYAFRFEAAWWRVFSLPAPLSFSL